MKRLPSKLALLDSCFLVPLLLVVSITSSNPIQGSDIFEEIVVTASLLQSDSQSVSVTFVDETDLRNRGAVHAEDILSKVPNVIGSGGASRNRFFQIRGIGERSQFVEPVNPSVGILLDGIDMSGSGGALTLFDIQQLEVLRGPQGTIMGANALAGLINLRSAATDIPVGEILIGTEQFGGHRISARASKIASNGLSARLAVQKYHSDGFVNNSWLNREDTNSRSELTSRGSIKWAGSENAVEGAVYYIRTNNGYDAFSLDNTRTTLSDQPGEDDLTLRAGRTVWRGQLGAYSSLIQLSHAEISTTYSYDEDWSFMGIAPGWEYSSFDQYLRNRDMSSIEARLQSDADSSEWITGFYMRNETEDLLRKYTYLPRPFESDIKTLTLAAFGQANRAFNDQLNAFLGIRLEHRDSDYEDNAGVSNTFKNSYWTGRTGISWQPYTHHQASLSLSRGARAGGVNANLLASITALEDDKANSIAGLGQFHGESLLSLELAWQFWRPATGLRSNLTIFAMDREDQQAKGSLVIPRDDGSTTFIDYTDNAAAGTHLGLEWEATWQINEYFRCSGMLGLLEARFDDYVTATGKNLDDRDQPQSPNWQYSLRGDWSLTSGVSLQMEITGADAHFFSDRHDVKSTEAHQINASLSGSMGRWQWTIWGRNLNDKTTFTRGFGTFGNDPRKQYALEAYRQYGEPRIVGITLSYDFLEDRR